MPCASFRGRTLSFGFDPGAQLRASRNLPLRPLGAKIHRLPPGPKLADRKFNCPAPIKSIMPWPPPPSASPSAWPPDQISPALASFRVWRNDRNCTRHESGLIIYNDCYNANPGSMAMALQTLAASQKPGQDPWPPWEICWNWASTTVQAHKDLGALAAQLSVDLLVVCGNFKNLVKEGALAAGMSATRVHAVPSHAAGAQIVKEFCRPGDTAAHQRLPGRQDGKTPVLPSGQGESCLFG